MARAQIAASLDLYGEKGRAGNAFASAFRLLQAKARTGRGRIMARDCGRCGDAGAGGREPADAKLCCGNDRLCGRPAGCPRSNEHTGECLAAAGGPCGAGGGGGIRLNIDGTETQGNYARTLSSPELVQAPITVTNVGTGDVAAVVAVTAVPEVPLPAGGQGFTIERSYFHLDGSTADAGRVPQNERLVAVVKVTQATSWPARIAITDLLPAGFEVDNPKLVRSADLAAFNWLPEITRP